LPLGKECSERYKGKHLTGAETGPVNGAEYGMEMYWEAELRLRFLFLESIPRIFVGWFDFFLTFLILTIVFEALLFTKKHSIDIFDIALR
jgi:hypothetical protein